MGGGERKSVCVWENEKVLGALTLRAGGEVPNGKAHGVTCAGTNDGDSRNHPKALVVCNCDVQGANEEEHNTRESRGYSVSEDNADSRSLKIKVAGQ